MKKKLNESKLTLTKLRASSFSGITCCASKIGHLPNVPQVKADLQT